MPAIWLPYGSTSISIKIDHEDLAWIFPELKNNLFNTQTLNSILKSVSEERRLLLIDPTLPVKIRDFFRKSLSGKIKELFCFDILKNEPIDTLTVESACLLSYPHFDPLIEFRGLGENIIPFYSSLWRDFRTDVLEAFKCGRVIDLKKYLEDINNTLDLKLIIFAPWAKDSQIVLKNNIVEAYEAITSFKHELLSKVPNSPVDLLIISAGGDPFDESLSRALSLFPNCLQGYDCERVLLIAEGSMGLGLDPEIFLNYNYNSKLEGPLILKYVSLCKSLLEDKSIYVVSAIPEPLLKIVLNSKAYDTLLDAYRASKLFLPKGSKTGVVTRASFTILKSGNGLNMDRGRNDFK